MKIGILVPQFQTSPAAALAVADAAERDGIDGVFTFDHLWSVGARSGASMSCFPLLAAIAARTRRVSIGTLVARVGIVPTDVLVNEFDVLHSVAGDRLIAGLGVGDKLSLPENEAYGLPLAPFAERLAAMDDTARQLSAKGIRVWFGGRSAAVRAHAVRCGAVVNQWQPDINDLQSNDTWAGRWTDLETFKQIEATGAKWAIFLVNGSSNDPEGAVQKLLV